MVNIMTRYFVLFILLISAIPAGIATYEYYYMEKDFVLSRGIYMDSRYICEHGVLYKRRSGAIFSSEGKITPCSIVTMTAVEKNRK